MQVVEVVEHSTHLDQHQQVEQAVVGLVVIEQRQQEHLTLVEVVVEQAVVVDH
tara:strand:- start:77 stop:235 length:159 start_codon:yes stop_codon:yes gene_type:complete